MFSNSLLLTYFPDPLSALGSCDFLHNMLSEVLIMSNVGIESKILILYFRSRSPIHLSEMIYEIRFVKMLKYLGGVKYFIAYNQFVHMENCQFKADHISCMEVNIKYCIFSNIQNFIKKGNRNFVFKKKKPQW